ncbi:tetratricopeptide repeat protein [Sphingomonas radiodurans]|uniref:tetratricopeptide repeat protein n=1 Tax=Sphingomonas radiodurans TaxID=2890321 RepID=UPI001E45C5C9|nr:tetratricopeptide repeat protein [Sphingomonas radiodurans]WBH15902.1 tetratricopeptide repeat protein [Sphingomonas radiodurans]
MGRTIRTCKLLALAAFVVAAPAQAATPDLLAYLKARAADGDDAAGVASTYYATALDASPDDPTVAAYAYRQAIAAGNLPLALRAAAALGAAAPADADLLVVADAAVRGDRAAVDSAIARLAKGQLSILAAPLAAWAELERGRDPMPLLATQRDDVVARRFASEARALILIAQGRHVEGVTALRVALGITGGQSSEDLRISAARLLIGAGRIEEARGLLLGDAAPIAALRAQPGDGAKATLGFGASALFTRVASDIALGPPGPLPLALAQAAVLADPANDRARLLLAYALGRGDYVDRALATLSTIAPDSPYAESANAGRVQIVAGADRMDEALAHAKTLAERGDPSAIQRYADLLMAAKRPADAAPLYRRMIGRATTDDGWALWLQYGGALDEAGDWRAARPALERAVTLAPNEPLALNYLGYARITRGEQIAESEALLERASRLRPDDMAITDSLGWAYHLSGKQGRALPLIERAAAASPDNAEIGEHLGDIYWALGRRFEARYAWRAALLVAEGDVPARLEAKIADGPAAQR